MRSGAVAAAENVPEVRFHHDARGVVLAETAQLPGEPLADRMTVETKSSRSFAPPPRNPHALDGVIPGGRARRTTSVQPDSKV